MNDIAGSRFPFSPDHRRAFGNAAQGLAEVARSANKGRGEGVLVDVVGLVGGGEDLGLVDEVYAELLENLGLGKVADAGLGHHWDRNRGNDLLDECRLGHAGDAPLGANHRRDAFEGHDRGCSGLFGDAGLLDVHHIHDDAALEHLGQADLEAQAGAAKTSVSVHFRHF